MKDSAHDPEKVAENDCVRCGSCTVVCPVYRASGGKEFYSARGRKYLQHIGEDLGSTAELQDIFSQCLLCGACSQVCPRGIDCTAHVRASRAQQSLYPDGYKKYLADKGVTHPETLSLVRHFGVSFTGLLGKSIPAESGLRLRLAMFEDEGDDSVSTKDHEERGILSEEKSSSKTALEKLIYFPGCTATYLTPALLKTHLQLFALIGYNLVVPDKLSCCGLSSLSTGNLGDAMKCGQQNIEALEQTDGPILVSCASCFSQFSSLATLFEGQVEWRKRAQRIADRCVELSRFLADKMVGIASATSAVGTRKLRVFYHDPCHFRYELKILAEPRTILKRLGNVELIELADGPQCCGMGGLFHLGSPEISARIRDDLKEKVLAQAPDIITTTCSACLMQWTVAIAATKSEVKVMHLSELLYSVMRLE